MFFGGWLEGLIALSSYDLWPALLFLQGNNHTIQTQSGMDILTLSLKTFFLSHAQIQNLRNVTKSDWTYVSVYIRTKWSKRMLLLPNIILPQTESTKPMCTKFVLRKMGGRAAVVIIIKLIIMTSDHFLEIISEKLRFYPARTLQTYVWAPSRWSKGERSEVCTAAFPDSNKVSITTLILPPRTSASGARQSTSTKV